MISPDPMNCGHSPQAPVDTAGKLALYTGTVTWDYLRPHYERDGLFFVDYSLTLEAVGAAIASNDSPSVQAWLKTGDLVRISALHAGQWEDKAELLFETLVVSPFVLCRPVPG